MNIEKKLSEQLNVTYSDLLKAATVHLQRFNIFYNNIKVELTHLTQINPHRALIKEPTLGNIIVGVAELELFEKEKTYKQQSVWACLDKDDNVVNILILEHDCDDIEPEYRKDYLYEVHGGHSVYDDIKETLDSLILIGQKDAIKEIHQQWQNKQMPFETDVEYQARQFLASHGEI